MMVIVDSGATKTVGARDFSLFSRLVQKVMRHAKMEIDVEAGRQMTFKLADGTMTCACPLVWMQTQHGWSRLASSNQTMFRCC